MTSIHSPQAAGSKRAYQPEDTIATPSDADKAASPPHSSASATSAFRNVSACNRCRVRKNRCDQKLPACSACEKASVRCVGYDPITKREIPRSYVYFLETRLSYFESLLVANKIPFTAPEAFDPDVKDVRVQSPVSTTGHGPGAVSVSGSPQITRQEEEKKREDERLNSLVSNIGMVSVQGASDHRYLGSTSGISFARVVLAAVKSSVSTNNSERAGIRPSKPPSNFAAAAGGSSMRDSYFGLQTKPTIKEAPFPDRYLGEKLVNLYFEHANPQIPTLHRVEFMEIFDRAYTITAEERTAREMYLLNIVFAIGAGIIWGSSDPEPNTSEFASKRPRLASQQAQPEEYHASAIVHLSSFLSSTGAEASQRPGGDLEELQAVLLLAGFALLRPVAPGLWYIVGVAVRLAVDLGLHYEDGSGLEGVEDGNNNRSLKPMRSVDAKEVGRRQWVRDLRRRLWWCTYTFDRLVSTCVGRPFGITDQVITTDFPSLLEDRYITSSGFLHPRSSDEPSYKRVAHHYFRLRLLQSEILQVLQYQQAQQVRNNGRHRDNKFMHTKLPSPFLLQHASFRSWRKDIDQRLWEWKESAPHRHDTGVSFSPQFLELNYWQAVIMLYRQSLSVPAPFAGELSPTEEVASPSSILTEDKEDEDLVFLKCAEAGQKTLKLYRQLHRQRLVNYTYLATHHLFMAGISFLYAVWHSPAVRQRLTLDDFDFTVLAATSVLGDLMEKCPPAESCRDAFDRMSKATVQMCMSTPGFGFGGYDEPRGHLRQNRSPSTIPMVIDTDMQQDYKMHAQAKGGRTKRPPPKFDMDLRELFPEDLEGSVRPSSSFPRPQLQLPRRQQSQGFSQRQPSYPAQNISRTSNTANINSQIGVGLGMDVNSASSNAFGMQQSPLQSSLPQRSSPNTSSFFSTNQNSYNPDFMSNLPGMEFLNHITTENNNSTSRLPPISNIQDQSNEPTPRSTAPASGADSWYDLNNIMSSGAAVDTADTESEWGYGSGFGCGVGMGLDFNPQHDWSDGQGSFDLFDGFFFGANEAGAPTGGP